MPFYKFIVRAGHQGIGKYAEMPIYLYGEDFLRAREYVSKFPAVKHDRAIINAKEIDERTYVIGLLGSGYRSIDFRADSIPQLSKIVKKLLHICNYQFKTEEGNQLKAFCDQYQNSNDENKELIEKEYVAWAENVINTNQDNLGF